MGRWRGYGNGSGELPMNDAYTFQIRVTGILLDSDRILLVQQRVSDKRSWSLPGGRLERGETLSQGMVREMKEETGLEVEILKLLYLCDVAASGNKTLHVTFLIRQTGGELTLPSNEYDQNPIGDVRFVPISQLEEYGFSKQFRQTVAEGFPDAGTYPGDKSNIGLGI